MNKLFERCRNTTQITINVMMMISTSITVTTAAAAGITTGFGSGYFTVDDGVIAAALFATLFYYNV